MQEHRKSIFDSNDQIKSLCKIETLIKEMINIHVTHDCFVRKLIIDEQQR